MNALHASNRVRHAVITGTGSYVPARVLTNADLARTLGSSIEPFVSETLGIQERHVSAPNESTVDLAEQAARRALDAAGRTAQDMDLIIVATDTPEYISPATSSVLHRRLGTLIRLDVQNLFSCTGGKSMPNGWIAAGRRALYSPEGECGFSKKHNEMLNMPAIGTMVFLGLRFDQ